VSPRRALAARCLGAALLLGALGSACSRSEFETLVTPDGRTRRYRVHRPPAHDGERRLPVVLVFHGGGGDVPGMVATTGMDAVADAHGFYAVYPEGTGRTVLGKHFGTWNAGACCGSARADGVDDVGFVSRLLDALAEDLPIDTRRVYATGISNGGFMASRLACELSDRIAAIAPVAGATAPADCAPRRPVPVLIFHGRADACVPIDGGERCGGCFTEALEELGVEPRAEDFFPCDAVEAAAERWRTHARCGPDAETIPVGTDTECRRWSACSEGAAVEVCASRAAGHTWPGSQYGCDMRRRSCLVYIEKVGPIATGVAASERIARFFLDHPRPE
jgi:polyhydroxybutyrate depolymerase